MNADDQDLRDLAHALDCELYDVWQARCSARSAGDPEAEAAFRDGMREAMLAAQRDPRATPARYRAPAAATPPPPAPSAAARPRDLGALAVEIYSQRAAAMREAAPTEPSLASDNGHQIGGARKVARGGLPDPAGVYAGRRLRTAEVAGA
jgi:hypothetical protein